MSFVDWKDEKEADEYLKTVNAEYSFSCYKEKDPEGKPATGFIFALIKYKHLSN